MNDITQPNKIGRPTSYSLELAEEICKTIASSSAGIKKLCHENANWPSHNTIYRWLNEHGKFSDLYARAKQCQIEVLIDEIIELSDDATHDSSVNDKGHIIANHENINRSKLRIDSRKWLASKLVPRVYGNKDQKECTRCAPHSELSQLSDEELHDLAKKLLLTEE